MEAALHDISDHTSSMIVTIDDSQLDLNIDSMPQLNEGQSIAFQCAVNGKFCVIWQHQKLHVLRATDSSMQHDLCRFIVEFIARCLSQGHSGEF